MKIDQHIDDHPQVPVQITKRIRDVSRTLNGNLSMGKTDTAGPSWPGENLDGVHILQAVGAANAPVVFTHNLNRVPTGYWIVGQIPSPLPPSIVYATTPDVQAWTNNTITLRFSGTGLFKIWVY